MQVIQSGKTKKTDGKRNKQVNSVNPLGQLVTLS